MSVLSSTGVFTRADLEALPDDGLRHELIDGAIFINPAPDWEFTRQDRLVDGHYLTTAAAAGSETVVLATPLASTLCPAELLVESGAQY